MTIIDPCTSTSIFGDPNVIENFVAFAGYTVVSQAKYSFNDTTSLALTQSTDSADFCGAKMLEFQLNGTKSTYLNASNADFINFNPPADTQDLGLSQARVQASMENYSNI